MQMKQLKHTLTANTSILSELKEPSILHFFKSTLLRETSINAGEAGSGSCRRIETAGRRKGIIVDTGSAIGGTRADGGLNTNATVTDALL